MQRLGLAILSCVLAFASPATADGYRSITDPSQFLSLVEGRTLVLTRPGIARPIALNVLRNGALAGEARGYELNGVWRWEGNRFCRQMDWGGFEVSYSCQDVSMNGNTLRFVADRGLFRTAYFEIR